MTYIEQVEAFIVNYHANAPPKIYSLYHWISLFPSYVKTH